MDDDPVTFRVLFECDADSDGEHVTCCARCGQAVDGRDLAEVLHHRRATHEPIALQL